MSDWGGCCYNYTGSKARFLDDIYKILPEGEGLSVLDLFTGGGSLATQLPTSWIVTANDKESRLVALHNCMQFISKDSPTAECAVEAIVGFVQGYVKDKEDKDGYNTLVSMYNNNPTSLLLYAMLCSSFSNQLRWNDAGEWNLPFGKRYFNPSMQKKLKLFLERLRIRAVEFVSRDFKDFDYANYDLVISDSPYLKAVAGYNERGGWGIADTAALMTRLDKASEAGTKFIMFEELWSNGKPNKPLIAWSSKYNVKQLGDNSSQCNYQRAGGKTQEVMIYNY